MKRLLVAVLAAALLSATGATAAEPLRIAAISPKTGPCAALGAASPAGEKAYYDHLAKRLGTVVQRCPVASTAEAATALAAGKLDLAVLDRASFAPISATARAILTLRPEGGLNRIVIVLAVPAAKHQGLAAQIGQASGGAGRSARQDPGAWRPHARGPDPAASGPGRSRRDQRVFRRGTDRGRRRGRRRAPARRPGAGHGPARRGLAAPVPQGGGEEGQALHRSQGLGPNPAPGVSGDCRAPGHAVGHPLSADRHSHAAASGEPRRLRLGFGLVATRAWASVGSNSAALGDQAEAQANAALFSMCNGM